MKILFHLRSDAETKPGGDVSLGRQYKKLLEENGHVVDLTTSSFSFESHYDLALTFNFDRPFESAQFIRNCKSKDIPVIIYALHHPTMGVSRYLKFGTIGLRRVFAILSLFYPRVYETILAILKVVSGHTKIEKFSHIKFLIVAVAQRYILNNAYRIIVSSNLEAKAICEEFKVLPKKLEIVPHILDILPGSDSAAHNEIDIARDIDIICAGRFESRKNQLEVARLAKSLPNVNFVFVGTASPSESAYFSKFNSEIMGLKNVQYYQSLPLDELRKLFRRSRLFISLSWFEVVSLTEMEALACGCYLIVGKYSYGEYFTSNRATFVEPNDRETIKGEILRRLAEASTVNNVADTNVVTRLLEMSPAQVHFSFSKIFDVLKGT